MSLHELSIDISEISTPDEVSAFITEANRRIDAYLDLDKKVRVAQYIPSDPYAIYAALSVIRRDGLACGDGFSEWGSGFGVATCLATMLGYDSVGIERDPVLCQKSMALAREFGIDCEIHCGDFVPNGFEYSFDYKENIGALVESSLLPSEEKYRDSHFDDPYPIDEFDVIFCYPWPGEAAMLVDLFDGAASEDTLLVTYCTVDGIRVLVKE